MLQFLKDWRKAFVPLIAALLFTITKVTGLDIGVEADLVYTWILSVLTSIGVGVVRNGDKPVTPGA